MLRPRAKLTDALSIFTGAGRHGRRFENRMDSVFKRSFHLVKYLNNVATAWLSRWEIFTIKDQLKPRK
jgi:hypothetical protein